MTRGAAVVLMYHRIGAGPLPGREPREEVYAVTRDDFTAQMAVLVAQHCPVVGFDVVADAARGHAPLPPRAIALTFDDGNATDASEVAPVLARHGHPATCFVTPGRIGTPGYLGWDDVRALHAAGLTIGAHGLDHTRLPTLADDELRRQLVEARREIAARIGTAPRFLSLPGGAGDARVLAAAAAAGYDAVASSRQRPVHAGRPTPAIPRFAIRHDEALARFTALVRHRPAMLWRRALREDWVRLQRSLRGH